METEPQSQLVPLPRSEAQILYRCFDRSFKVELVLSMLFFPALLTLWIFTAYYYYYTGRFSLPIAKAAVYSTTVFILALIFYGNARAILRGRLVIVDRDRIARKGADGRVGMLSYANISGIRRPRAPLFKKRMVLESSQKTLAVPLCIRGGHEMVERIFRKLEENGLFFEGLADLKRGFYGVARRFNVRQTLRAMYVPNLVRAATAAALLNGGVALIYWKRGVVVMIVWGFFNMLLQAGAYFVTERIHVNRLLSGKLIEEHRVKKLLGEDGGAGGVKGEDAVGAFSGYYVMAGMIALLMGMGFGILRLDDVMMSIIEGVMSAIITTP